MDARMTIPRCRPDVSRLGIGVALLAIAIAGCGKDEGTPTSPGGGGGGGSGSTSFAGTMLGANVSGSFALSIQTASLSPAPRAQAPSLGIPLMGTMTFTTGGPVAFTGSYDNSNDSLHFSVTDSLGGVYEFHGKLDRSSTLTVVFGNWSGGQPLETGAWGAYQGNAASVKAHCGSFSGTHAGIVNFLTREVVIDGGRNGRVVGVLWLTINGLPAGAYPFKGWAVDYQPPTPPVRTLQIDGTVPGVYEIYFSGELNEQSGAFSAVGGVEDLQNPQNIIFGQITGSVCP